MVDQTWISNAKHTTGVKLLHAFCSVDEPQKLLLSPKLCLDHIVCFLLLISFSFHFQRRITRVWMHMTLPHFPQLFKQSTDLEAHRELEEVAIMLLPFTQVRSEKRIWTQSCHCAGDYVHQPLWGSLRHMTLMFLIYAVTEILTGQVGLLSTNWVSCCLLSELVLPPSHSVSCTEVFYTQLQEEPPSTPDPTTSFSMASGALALGAGEGSLNSPREEPDLNSCLPGGTVLRLFLPFVGKYLSKMIKPINPSLGGFSSQPFWTPRHTCTSSQSVGTRTGQSISAAVSPRLPTETSAPPFACLNTIVAALESKAEEGRTDCREVDSILIIKAHG